MSAGRRIVVLGMMAKMPVPGVVWQTLHYLIGLRRLGFDPFYVEAHARAPSMLMKRDTDDGSRLAAEFLSEVLTSFDLGQRWAYQALHDDGRCFGLSERALRDLYREAELIINLHGGTRPREELSESGRLVFLETDPVRLQIELHDGVAASVDFLAAHCAYFTFAENLGRPECSLPVCERFEFHPTRQPVVLDLWRDHGVAPSPAFTTIGNWRQRWRTVRYEGEDYGWSKDVEWRKFIDLPARTGQAFELALSGYEPSDAELLVARGWNVRPALELFGDHHGYRDFIAGSRGEFTVAKDQNVRFNTGWFSDRSATYLAAGRPVITQDTGFGTQIPTGAGLFAVRSADEAVQAVGEVNADYARHCHAASDLAHEYFDSDRVLRDMLERTGVCVEPPAQRAPAAIDPTTPTNPRALNDPMTAMPTVSVVIPCFNLGAFLTEAVDSVLAQTRAATELIVVDDGSDDPPTLDVLNALRDRGVRAYRTENRGAPSARNYGIERARGELILCLDADDVLMPRFLEATTALLAASPDVAVVASQVEFFGEQTGTWQPPPYSLSTALWRNCLPSASLFRRSCWTEVGGYAPELDACQDWDLWLSMLERGWKWAVVEEPLYRYRRRAGSISERREQERPRILRQMMGRHAGLYAAHAIDAIIELDAELIQTRERLARFRCDNAAQAERIVALEETARPPEHEQAEPFRGLVETHVPEGATVLVVTKGDADLLKVGNRESWHFPRRPDGEWLGHHPKTQESAIEMLESERANGAQFLCFPRDERWWLKRYEDFRRYLEGTYSVVARTEEGVIFDVRQEITRRTFSVVICTYRRPELIARSMQSVLDQRYPKDRYELIVVNNASPDDTEQIVQNAARQSPMPFTYLVEERNGLSHARNTGIAAARHEFVAFLDDDAIACPDWLATFNAVIDEHHAMIVGGRVEKAFDDGYEPPDWFHYQYTKHMFGVNYRDRGRTEKVFRIRYPLYLGGGNITYARRLFERFGGFDPRLGRDGKSLRGGEESYLNLVLDQHDIPMYYADDAWIDHYLETSRLTKKHLRRKAYWSGATNAVMHPLFFGFPEIRGRTRNNRKEIARKLGEIRKERKSPENFSRQLRIIYNVSFLMKFHMRSAAHRLGAHRSKPPEVSWGAADWIEEVRGWPESADKYERLLTLAREAGDGAIAEEAGRWLAARPDRRPPSAKTATKHLTRAEYERLIGRVRQRVNAQVPPGAVVAVLSKGDTQLLQFDGRSACHFPQLSDGTYAGHYPKDDAAAIVAVEEVRQRGATHLLFPATASWWHDHYRGLAEHLDAHHERAWDESDVCVIYRLDAPKRGGPGGLSTNGSNGHAPVVAGRDGLEVAR